MFINYKYTKRNHEFYRKLINWSHYELKHTLMCKKYENMYMIINH